MIPYTLTSVGWAASQPRRPECGHVVCVDRDECAYAASAAKAAS